MKAHYKERRLKKDTRVIAPPDRCIVRVTDLAASPGPGLFDGFVLRVLRHLIAFLMSFMSASRHLSKQI